MEHRRCVHKTVRYVLGSNDFLTQKVYFLQLMRVYVVLIMLNAYFCHSR
jgi:hypothetical protein